MHSSRHRVQSPPAEGPDGTGDAEPAPTPLLEQLGSARSTWAMDRQAAATLPGLPASVADARLFVRITAAMWRLPADTVADVELCMSELVSNAVTHTGSHRVHCRLWSARGLLFLEVDDEERRGVPQRDTVEEDDEHGRGMMLVESCTTAWGTIPRAGFGGKTVWAALLLPG
jgi:anti-sigma regulatory factor (Ser/Thr protein kinase)